MFLINTISVVTNIRYSVASLSHFDVLQIGQFREFRPEYATDHLLPHQVHVIRCVGLPTGHRTADAW